MSWRHHLPGQLAGEAIGARLADRVDGEAARPIEVDGARAAADGGDLRDVVRRRLGGERAEQRQRDVDAVEVVDVVLAAAAGARPAHRILRVLHAGNQLQQIAILLPDRQRHDLLVRHAALERRRIALDERHRRGDVDGLAQRLNAHRGIDDRVLAKLHLRLAGHRLHAGERERDRVVSRRQRRQAVFPRGFGDGDARRRQHVGARFHRHAGQHATARVGDLPAHLAGLLGGRRHGGQQRQEQHERTTDRTRSNHPLLQQKCKSE